MRPSTDPSYFGGYVNENYRAVTEALTLSLDEIMLLARNSYLGSFLSDPEKRKALDRFEDFARKF